ncbi:MAG: hypothetical protein LBJ88_04110 [Campylobacteraceae bacterium]|jgi:hypothetical protein|nr:hypothetical protein [Campylobacteraceae bacterium]
MRKILLSLGIVSACFAYDVDVFKDGFETGLNALQFQIKNDGVIPQKIDLRSPFIVILPIENIPMNEIIYIQYISHKEDFKTTLTENGIIFGDYDRKIDANEVINKIKRVLNYDAKIIDNVGEFYTYPILAKPVYDLIAEGLKKDGVIKDVKVVYANQPKASASTTKTTSTASQTQKSSNTKTISLKHPKAQSYRLDGDKKYSKNYVESFIVEGGTFKTANTFVTNEGEAFVKVYNENIFFLRDDVEFK